MYFLALILITAAVYGAGYLWLKPEPKKRLIMDNTYATLKKDLDDVLEWLSKPLTEEEAEYFSQRQQELEQQIDKIKD